MANIDITVGWNGSAFYVTYDNLDDAVAATTTTFSGQYLGNAHGVVAELEDWNPPTGGNVNAVNSNLDVGFFTAASSGGGGSLSKQFYLNWKGTNPNDDITITFDQSFNFMTDAMVTDYNGGTGPYAGSLSTVGNSLGDQYGSNEYLSISLQGANGNLDLQLEPLALAGGDIVRNFTGTTPTRLREWYDGDRQDGTVETAYGSRGAEDVLNLLEVLHSAYGYVGEFPTVGAASLELYKAFIGFDSLTSGVTCFTTGALIRTPAGDVKVEDIRIGDQITTLNNGTQKVRWVGRTTITEETLKQFPDQYAPIRIKKGAMGNDRDLLVSPQHRMLVTMGDFNYVDLALEKFEQTSALVASKALVNGDDIYVDQDQGDVTYFHIMFDNHEVVFAENAPSESFCIGQHGLEVMSEATRHELYDFFPELEWEIMDCKPAMDILRPGQIRQAAKHALKRKDKRLAA